MDNDKYYHNKDIMKFFSENNLNIIWCNIFVNLVWLKIFFNYIKTLFEKKTYNTK